MDEIARYYQDLRIPITRRGGVGPFINALQPIMRGTLAITQRLFEEVSARESNLPNWFDENEEMISIAQRWCDTGMHSLSNVRERTLYLRYNAYWTTHHIDGGLNNSVSMYACWINSMTVQIADTMERIFKIQDFQKSVEKRLKEQYAITPTTLKGVAHDAIWITTKYYTNFDREEGRAIVANSLLAYPRID